MIATISKLLPIAIGALCLSASAAFAGPLKARADAGEAIRIGFANSPPYAYVGKDGKPEGFMNAYALDVLKKMGYTKIEVTTSDWAGLIPALQAGRIDIITSGMYIQKGRCENIAFSQPMLKTSDALLVPKGNPKGLGNYADIAKKGAVMATVSGYATIKNAKGFGVKDEQIMQLPDGTAVLAAVKSGRADAAANTYVSLLPQANSSNGTLEIADPSKMPESTVNWVSYGFRKNDADFVSMFDATQKSYLGSPAMMKAVAPYGYTEAQFPGTTSLDWICANR